MFPSLAVAKFRILTDLENPPESIGFGVTVSTTYEQPYHLARRLSTVDHLTKGR